MQRALYVLAMVGIVGLAVWLRVGNLKVRPMHNDEGVNAVKFDELRRGKFEYDPAEYHGPTLFYFTLPVAWVMGAKDFASTDEVTLRMVAVIFGVGLILLLPLVADGLGRGGVLWAGLFTAVSPAFVFYSRYYIHEMPLVFFAFGAIACGWRYRRSNRVAWAAACGAFIGLTYATKETWVLALAAAAGSAVTAATIWRLLIKGIPHHLHFRKRAVAIGFAAFVVVFVLFFSGFFTRMKGVADAVTAYTHYSGRASGGVHDHPWNYYLKLIMWSPLKANADAWWWNKGWTEGAIVVLGVVGFLLAVLRRHVVHGAGHVVQENAGGKIADEEERQKDEKTRADRNVRPTIAHPLGYVSKSVRGGVETAKMFPAFPPFVRFVGFYSLFLVVGFSIIPYKTPWCMLGFLHGMILMAGFACGQIVHAMPGNVTKSAGALVLLAAAGHLMWEADRATNNFFDPKHPNRYAASRENPYVYAHTGMDLLNLVKRVEEIASVSPKGKKIAIDVVTADCWPLPFYLREFKSVGYPMREADYQDADVVIGSVDESEKPIKGHEKLKAFPGIFALRPGVFLSIYTRPEILQKLQEKWSR